MKRVMLMIALGGALVAAELTAQGPQVWSLSPDARVLGRGYDELFESVRFGRLYPGGGAVVADAAGLFVRSYASNGFRKWTFGRDGDGPGEFRGVFGLWVSLDGTVGVWDGQTRRLTFVDSTGRLSSTVRVSSSVLDGNLELFFGSYPNGDLLLGALRLERVPAPGQVVTETWSLGRFSLEGQLRATLGQVEGMRRMRRAPLPFTPVSWIALRGDSLLFVEGYENTVQVAGDVATASRRIELPFRRSATQAAYSALERQLRERNRGFFLDLLREAPRSEEFPQVAGLVVDDTGHVWIKEYDPERDALWLKSSAVAVAPGGTWHVVDMDGSAIATMRVPANFVLLDVARNQALGVEHDQYDVQRVVIRQIIR